MPLPSGTPPGASRNPPPTDHPHAHGLTSPVPGALSLAVRRTLSATEVLPRVLGIEILGVAAWDERYIPLYTHMVEVDGLAPSSEDHFSTTNRWLYMVVHFYVVSFRECK